VRVWWALLPLAGFGLLTSFLLYAPAPQNASPQHIVDPDGVALTGVQPGLLQTLPPESETPTLPKPTSVAASHASRQQAAAPAAIAPGKPVAPAPSGRDVARDVGGALIAAPDLDEAVLLERLAPLPANKLLPERPEEKPNAATTQGRLLFRPLALNAGVIAAEGRTITLTGLMPVEVSRTCLRSDGSSWPCGMAARTAMRQYLRSRAVTCTLPDQKLETLTTDCRIGRQDIAEWLVEQGWAEAETGSALSRLGDAAKAMGRGIHGDGR
jgi:endonuclease YncB( thermonuclease family)